MIPLSLKVVLFIAMMSSATAQLCETVGATLGADWQMRWIARMDLRYCVHFISAEMVVLRMKKATKSRKLSFTSCAIPFHKASTANRSVSLTAPVHTLQSCLERL